jgi:putative flippase GtrA
LFQKISALLKKFLTKEFILYIVFGVGTTLVNFAVFYAASYFFTPEKGSWLYLLINFIAWVAAVLFAYFTNKLFVFNTRGLSAAAQLKEFFSFVAARLTSLGLEELSILIFVNILLFDGLIVKLVLEVFVVITNYFFSKYVVFKKKKTQENNE